MEEKKKWYYTRIGKVIRGFLCVLTLALCTVGTIYIIQTVCDFGDQVFIDQAVQYEHTNRFRIDLNNAVGNVLDCMIGYDEEMHEFSVYDTEKNQLLYCNSYKKRDAAYEDFWLPVYDHTDMEMKFDDLEWVKEIIKQSDGSQYIYFSREEFQNLFEKCGMLNTNHRFSKSFPESTYFIFKNQEAILGMLDSEKEEGYEYALYNPEEDLFYSTWDNYFPSYDYYIYNAEELWNSINWAINENGEKTVNELFDNIVIPLLWSKNYLKEEMLPQYLQDPVEQQQNVYMKIKSVKEMGFVFHAEKDVLSDVLKEDMVPLETILQMDLYYTIDVKRMAVLDANGEVCDWVYVNPSLQDDTNIWIGYDFKNVNGTKEYPSIHYQYFQFAKKYGMIILVLLFLGYLLLLCQTISLIVTTGYSKKKTEKESGEISLNWFDKWMTEPYLFIQFIVLTVATVGSAYCCAEALSFLQQTMEDSLLFIGCITFLYGFIFMVFVLSMIRRLKAKNYISRLGSVRLVKQLVKWGREFIYQKKGKKWLYMVFLLYFAGQLIFVLYFLSEYWNKESPLLPFLFFFFVLNALIIYIMNTLLQDMDAISKCINQIKTGELEQQCETEQKLWFLNDVADGVNHIRDGLKIAVEQSIRDERMKTELITNVSHDLKTPLTSIINYVDLLKKEEMHSEQAKHYLEVLDSKSQRLKHLTEDLVEAAKANTGNVELECMPLAFDELMRQAIGEFEDKFATRKLQLLASYPKDATVIMADGRRLFRVVENILVNAYKYALEGTRVYADLKKEDGTISFTLKNVSKDALNISPDELMERFTRGDGARTTEGSGLGLSIAKDLTALMQGTFTIELDGDLFKVILEFPEYSTGVS